MPCRFSRKALPSCVYWSQYLARILFAIFCTIIMVPGISGTQIRRTKAVRRLPAAVNMANSVMGARNA